MKKISTSLLVAICLTAFISVPAFAGEKQRHRWEGVAIGVGAAILGHAILSNHDDHRDDAPTQVTVIQKEDRHHRARAAHHEDHRRKARKVWVPPVCERVWNSGHYNRRGDWVTGRWITLETQPGYWAKEGQWRACR